MRLAMQPIKPRKNLFDYRDYEYEIREAIADMGDTLVDALDKVVANWSHDVTFTKRITVGGNTVSVDVYPTGENAMIFTWVDKGTRPHVIEPKGNYPLKFQQYYATRTSPGGRYGGPGKKFGPVIRAWGVYHPGTDARNFTGKILDEHKAAFVDAIRDAIREAQR